MCAHSKEASIKLNPSNLSKYGFYKYCLLVNKSFGDFVLSSDNCSSAPCRVVPGSIRGSHSDRRTVPECLPRMCAPGSSPEQHAIPHALDSNLQRSWEPQPCGRRWHIWGAQSEWISSSLLMGLVCALKATSNLEVLVPHRHVWAHFHPTFGVIMKSSFYLIDIIIFSFVVQLGFGVNLMADLYLSTSHSNSVYSIYRISHRNKFNKVQLVILNEFLLCNQQDARREPEISVFATTKSSYLFRTFEMNTAPLQIFTIAFVIETIV